MLQRFGELLPSLGEFALACFVQLGTGLKVGELYDAFKRDYGPTGDL